MAGPLYLHHLVGELGDSLAHPRHVEQLIDGRALPRRLGQQLGDHLPQLAAVMQRRRDELPAQDLHHQPVHVCGSWHWQPRVVYYTRNWCLIGALSDSNTMLLYKPTFVVFGIAVFQQILNYKSLPSLQPRHHVYVVYMTRIELFLITLSSVYHTYSVVHTRTHTCVTLNTFYTSPRMHGSTTHTAV